MQRFLLVVCTLLSAFATIAHAQMPLTLAQNGQSRAVIALAQDAIPAERTAAAQLQKYLQQMTGATFAIQPEQEVADNAPQILVGQAARSKALLPNANWSNPGKDGIIIHTTGNKLILAGERPRGTLYAVFQFLEDNGSRFWWPGAYDIPRKSTLTVTPQNVHYVPPFSYRQHSSVVGHSDEEFATMLRLNGNRQPQSQAWGSHYEILGWVHTFSKLLPVEKHFAGHPEWYSDPTNNYKPATAQSKQPSPQGTDLCLGNPQVLQAVTEQALSWIEKNPEAGYISISQNDNSGGYCRDDYAVKLIEEEGSPSAPLLQFVNQVAAKIHEKYPHFLVETLAYHYSEKPPKTIRPAKNVLVRLAPISMDYGHPLDSEKNATARNNLLAWEKVSTQLFVWNYVTNFVNTLLPHPNFDSLDKDLRFYAAHKVTGIYQQANSYTNDVGDFVPLRTYLISRLLWNPQLDKEKIIDEFLSGYYGKAAPHLKQYLQLIDRSFPREQTKLNTLNSDYSFLTLDVMNQATRHFDQAAAAVQNDKTRAERVARERFSLDLAWLMYYRLLRNTAGDGEFLGPKDPQQAFANWQADAERFGVKNYGERRPLPNLLSQINAAIVPPAPLPDFARGLAKTDVFDIIAPQFELSQKWGQVLADEASTSGQAARVSGETDAWAIKAWIGRLISNSHLGDHKWRVVALARVEPKPGAPLEGTGIQGGIYDVTNRKYVSAIKIPLKDIADGKYRQIELGTAPLNGGMYIWVAPLSNSSVNAIYVDRILLLKE